MFSVYGLELKLVAVAPAVGSYTNVFPYRLHTNLFLQTGYNYLYTAATSLTEPYTLNPKLFLITTIPAAANPKL